MEPERNGGGYPTGIGDADYPVSRRGRTRCTAQNRWGRRCARYAILGHHLCKHHGGRKHELRLRAQSRYAEYFKSDSTLQDRFLALLDDPDITDLRPELAIQRAILAQYLELAAIGDGRGLLNDAVASAITDLNKSVGELAEKVSRIEKRGEGYISVLQLGAFVELVVGIITDVIADGVALDAIQRRLEVAALPAHSQAAVARRLSNGGSSQHVPETGQGGGGTGTDRSGDEGIPECERSSDGPPPGDVDVQ